MAITSAFQADDAGSIPAARSKLTKIRQKSSNKALRCAIFLSLSLCLINVFPLITVYHLQESLQFIFDLCLPSIQIYQSRFLIILTTELR